MERSPIKNKELHKESILEQVKEIRTSSGDVTVCPYCGHDVRKSWEWCPECGHSLVDWCTFCGAEIPRGEDECPECGMGRRGVECPVCGTRNATAFCRKCNEPLTLAAKKELERALSDPAFVKAAELAVKAAELQAMIDADGQGTTESEDKVIELPEDVLRLKELLKKTTLRRDGGLDRLDKSSGHSDRKGQERPVAVPVEAPVSSPLRQAQRPQGSVVGQQARGPKSKAELRAEYSKVKEELNKALEGMLPPAGSTPQEQRNYFSARKLPVEKTILTKSDAFWVCNFCGCWHNCPSECCEPWHGGKWVYDYKEEKVLEFK